MDTYPTFSSIIDAFGGSKPFGEIIGKPIGTASAMKTRDAIPPAHWDAVVRGAVAAGLGGITHELLSRLYASRRSPTPVPEPMPAPTKPMRRATPRPAPASPGNDAAPKQRGRAA